MKRKVTLLSAFAATSMGTWAAELDAYEIKPDVIYGHKMGMALTYDAVRPKANANGAGVMFMVSGGWVSTYVPPEKALTGGLNQALGFTKLLDKGYALYFVRHGSSPRFLVPDAVEDVRKAARHVRATANEFGVDPARLGVFGASAGGHLSLMLGTTGEDGDPNGKDALAKAGSRVKAVVAIFPPSELQSYHSSEKMRKDFPALTFDAAKVDAMSPIKQVTPDDAPTLLLHGGKDELVPDKHSKEIHALFRDKGVATDIILFPEAGHSFIGADQEQSVAATVAWFEKHLSKSEAIAEKKVEAKPASANPLVGEWAVEVTVADQDPRDYTLKFAEDGGALKGVLVSPRSGEFPAESVKLDGGDFTVKVKRKINDMEMVMVYTGKVENGAMSGKVQIEGQEGLGEGKLTGKKK